MSWNIEATGTDKADALSAFDDAVDNDAYCEPKEVVKDVARVLSEHMDEEAVSKVRTYGHTNADGKQCNVAVLINC